MCYTLIWVYQRVTQLTSYYYYYLLIDYCYGDFDYYHGDVGHYYGDLINYYNRWFAAWVIHQYLDYYYDDLIITALMLIITMTT